MKPARKVRMIFYLVYLLILVAAGIVLYQLIPPEIIDAIRSTYMSESPGGL